MNRNKITVKLTGRTFFQKAGGKSFWRDGVQHYERVIISSGCLTREIAGLDLRCDLRGVGPLEAPAPRLSVAKQTLEFIACAHVRIPKLKRVIENALGISAHEFNLRIQKC